MFILRRIIGSHAHRDEMTINIALGNSYNLLRRLSSPAEFDSLCKVTQVDVTDDLYACLVYRDGSEVHPLYKKSKYYIMTESGQTFENLSY